MGTQAQDSSAASVLDGPNVDEKLAAFAIRVIERAGTNGQVAFATRVLRSARSRVPERERGDVDWALQRLRVKAQAEASNSLEPAPVARLRPVTRERGHLSTVARRRAR